MTSRRAPQAANGEIAPSTLAACEAVIEHGLATFVEVGVALLTIRDGRLYRESHGTFEDYCRERWGFTDRHARRLIESAEVVLALPESGPMGPVINERQARELTPLKDKPEEIAAAWREVVKETDGKPTALAVREVVAQRLPARPMPAPRTDVVGVMAQVLTYADRAARAAEEITRAHLKNRPEDAVIWRDNLAVSHRALLRLLGLLEEVAR